MNANSQGSIWLLKKKPIVSREPSRPLNTVRQSFTSRMERRNASTTVRKASPKSCRRMLRSVLPISFSTWIMRSCCSRRERLMLV